MSRETVLVVDGSRFGGRRIKQAIARPGREVFLAGSAAEAISALPELRPLAVILSLDLPDMPGAAAVDLLRKRAGAPVIAVTESPEIGLVVEAMRVGASDVLPMPDGRERLVAALARALAERGPAPASVDPRERGSFEHLVSQSPRMLSLFDAVRAVAPTEATVLIRGETGSGKELVSRAIHARSRRRDKPFVAVNCGAFTETLLESELFGHEKGSFTGAVGRREGLFEMADGGTLFLDELGETSLNVQVNLLRVLETMTFRRVGGRDEVKVDVRVVAATNVALEDAVRKREFREDLYYRLNVFPIFIPPLRARREDIPLLMRGFLDDFAEEYQVEPPIVSSEAMDAILSYGWPGNVRQLRAFCERWVILRAGARLEASDLPSEIAGARREAEPGAALAIDDNMSLEANLRPVIERVERAYLSRLLRRNAGHLGQTAEAAGITRRTLYTRLKALGIDAREFKASDAEDAPWERDP
jgi:DNA-binding NtrC family response regulator